MNDVASSCCDWVRVLAVCQVVSDRLPSDLVKEGQGKAMINI